MYNTVRLKSKAKLHISFSSLLCHMIYESLWSIWIEHMFLETVLSSLNLQFDLSHDF